MFLPGFPAPDGDRVQWFTCVEGTSAVVVSRVQIWSKPRSCTLVDILLVGAGGGGGGGANSSTAGAGGGGSGGVSHYLFVASDLPDQLYIWPGRPGPGGAAGADGTVGGFSYVLTFPNLVTGNFLCAAQAGGGGLSVGTAGAAGAASSATTAPLGQIALFQRFYGGQDGGTGSSVKPSTVTPTGLTCGGGGGSGSTASDGGDIDAIGPLPKLPGGVYSGGNGSSLIQQLPINGMFFGGAGGASGDPAGVVGGAGGNGGYGCGGGGGGASSAGGGAGGMGGPGLVIMACR